MVPTTTPRRAAKPASECPFASANLTLVSTALPSTFVSRIIHDNISIFPPFFSKTTTKKAPFNCVLLPFNLRASFFYINSSGFPVSVSLFFHTLGLPYLGSIPLDEVPRVSFNLCLCLCYYTCIYRPLSTRGPSQMYIRDRNIIIAGEKNAICTVCGGTKIQGRGLR